MQAYDTSGLYSIYSNEKAFYLSASGGDIDSDGIPDDEDNCPDYSNPDQEDNENDGLGDVCDSDDDNDAIGDIQDNCPYTPNGYFGTCVRGDMGMLCISDYGCGDGGFCSMRQEDTDGDGLGDVCDPDMDGDGISNNQDDCPFDPYNDIDNDDILSLIHI